MQSFEKPFEATIAFLLDEFHSLLPWNFDDLDILASLHISENGELLGTEANGDYDIGAAEVANAHHFNIILEGCFVEWRGFKLF